MPNRILKESICTSDKIEQLSWFEEVLFYRLIVNCDDFGRFDGRAAVVRSRLFPLKANVTDKSVVSALNKLATVGLVKPYITGGKPILQLPTWRDHQTVRAVKSRYPAPDPLHEGAGPSPTVESNCFQQQADDCNGMQMSPYSYSNSNSYSLNDSLHDADAPCRPPAQAPPQESATPVIELPLNDGSHWPVGQTDVDNWTKLYPGVDVPQQLRAMCGWLDANPTRRKTKSGIKKFVNAWLAREQDRGPSHGKTGKPAATPAKGGALDNKILERFMREEKT